MIRICCNEKVVIVTRFGVHYLKRDGKWIKCSKAEQRQRLDEYITTGE